MSYSLRSGFTQVESAEYRLIEAMIAISEWDTQQARRQLEEALKDIEEALNQISLEPAGGRLRSRGQPSDEGEN